MEIGHNYLMPYEHNVWILLWEASLFSSLEQMQTSDVSIHLGIISYSNIITFYSYNSKELYAWTLCRERSIILRKNN